jgi:hypothetical protein
MTANAQCECVCKPDIVCTGNQTLDPKTCACTCQATQTCQKNETFDKGACACVCAAGKLLDTVTVPVNSFSEFSRFTLRTGVAYLLKASGTFKTGLPPLAGGDAEYAFDMADPSNAGKAKDRCGDPGNEDDMGIAINSGAQQYNKYPKWGAYNSAHIYTTTYTPGYDGVVGFSYHDCNPGANSGSLTLEVYCPG